MSVVENRRRIAEFGKAEALNIARGQFIVLLDADNEIVQDDWLRRALDTFRVFPDIFGFESHYLRIPHGNPINNYLTSCLHINEPLAYDIAVKPSLVETRRQEDLFLRKYLLRPGYPCGANGFVFRRESLVDFVGQESLEEGTVSLRLALSGRAYFAMIDGYGIRHYYISSMSKYLRKRAKIALKHVTRQSERDTWVEHTGFRLYLFAILHLTVLYPLLYSIVKACKSLDPLWLYHAPMAFLTTSVYLLNWIRIRFCRRRAW
jgi:glycosyltransferase involved in cell wall biosynthesis